MEVKQRRLERRVEEERLVSSVEWQEAFIEGTRDVLINMFVYSSS